MNIPESNGQRRIVPGNVERVDQVSNSKPGKKQQSTPAGQAPTTGYEPDSKLANLVSRLNESDHIRKDVVASADQQVQSGELLTREKAEQTAASILGIIKHL